jgi:SPW repeat-containing protein
VVDRGKSWIGWAAVVVGGCAVLAAMIASSTPVGQGFAVGFGAFIAFFGVLAVLARNRRPDHWGLVVVGLGMFILPFLGNGYLADPGASWTCWVAGGFAMILGGVGWTTTKTPIANALTRIGSEQAQRGTTSYWIGCAALAIGLATVLRGIAMPGTTTGTAVTIGLGGLTAVIALWSLLAVDPTHDFFTLAITGFALFLSPWVGGFVGEDAAVTSWVVGALGTALGVAGYLRGECVDFAATVHSDAAAQYHRTFRPAR